MPYADQLAQKAAQLRGELDKLESAFQGDVAQRQLTSTHTPLAAGLPALAVVPSPRLTAYRNKCEFSFGPDADGAPTLGFMLGQFRDGIVAVQVAPSVGE